MADGGMVVRWCAVATPAERIAAAEARIAARRHKAEEAEAKAAEALAAFRRHHPRPQPTKKVLTKAEAVVRARAELVFALGREIDDDEIATLRARLQKTQVSKLVQLVLDELEDWKRRIILDELAPRRTRGAPRAERARLIDHFEHGHFCEAKYLSVDELVWLSIILIGDFKSTTWGSILRRERDAIRQVRERYGMPVMQRAMRKLIASKMP